MVGDSSDKNQISHQKRYFDIEYNSYNEYHLENWRKSYINRIFSELDILPKNNKEDIYLDIGVGGSGYTIIEAAKRGIMAIGCDLSMEGILKAKKFSMKEKVDHNTFFVVCSADLLPFKNSKISKVSSIAVLEHIHDDIKAIKEIYRVSKNNAKIFINVPNTYKRIFPFLWLPYYLHDKRIGHLRHYSEEELLEKFIAQGFKVKKIMYSGHLIKLVQIVLSKFIGSDKLWWKLENMDLKKKNDRWGLQLNAVFEKHI